MKITTWEIRREPGAAAKRRAGLWRHSPYRRIATVQAASERDALMQFERMERVVSAGWSRYDENGSGDPIDGTGLDWRDGSSYSEKWNADDGIDRRNREYRLRLRFRRQHIAAFRAWRAR